MPQHFYIPTAYISVNTKETINNYQYRSKTLKLKFPIPTIPENSIITGIELTLHAENNVYSEVFKLDDRSVMMLPYSVDVTKIQQSELLSDYLSQESIENYKSIKKVPINLEDIHWKKGKQIYTIGGKNFLFNEDKITKEQLGKSLEFRLGFSNQHNFLQDIFLLHKVSLTIYYQLIPDKFSIEANLSDTEILIGDGSEAPYTTNLTLNVKNEGTTLIKNKNIMIVIPPELYMIYDKSNNDNILSFDFDLDINEEFVIGDKENPILINFGRAGDTDLTKLTGYYDILIMCDDKIIKKELLIRRGNNNGS